MAIEMSMRHYFIHQTSFPSMPFSSIRTASLFFTHSRVCFRNIAISFIVIFVHFFIFHTHPRYQSCLKHASNSCRNHLGWLKPCSLIFIIIHFELHHKLGFCVTYFVFAWSINIIKPYILHLLRFRV